MKSTPIVTILLGILVFLPSSYAVAEKVGKTTTFKVPDIHDDFCGAKIDYRVCKCARHGEMCKDIGRERNVANYILQSKFKIYVTTLRAQFALSCTMGGGRVKKDVCEYYEKTDTEKKCLPPDFDTNWKKYSDIDQAIPPAERSFEAKSVYEVGEKLKSTLASIYVLERDIEMSRLMLGELKDYRKAVATNFKVNMLKSFWRLAWLAYDTSAGAAAPMRFGADGTFLLQGGTDLGRSLAKMFTDDLAHGQKLAILAKLARESMGSNSKYAFDTTTLDGKLGAVSMTTLIAGLENIGSPVEAAKEMFQEITKQSLPAVDVQLSKEDIDLLAGQYNKTKVLDDALQEANRKRVQMETLRDELLKDKERLTAEFAEWEAKERERTQKSLTEDCKK